jgi:hypothetical protein
MGDDIVHRKEGPISRCPCPPTSPGCGATDPWVVDNCAIYGLCASSRREVLRMIVDRQYGPDGRQLFDQRYQQFVETMRKGDIGALM